MKFAMQHELHVHDLLRDYSGQRILPVEVARLAESTAVMALDLWPMG